MTDERIAEIRRLALDEACSWSTKLRALSVAVYDLLNERDELQATIAALQDEADNPPQVQSRWKTKGDVRIAQHETLVPKEQKP